MLKDFSLFHNICDCSHNKTFSDISMRLNSYLLYKKFIYSCKNLPRKPEAYNIVSRDPGQLVQKEDYISWNRIYSKSVAIFFRQHIDGQLGVVFHLILSRTWTSGPCKHIFMAKFISMLSENRPRWHWYFLLERSIYQYKKLPGNLRDTDILI